MTITKSEKPTVAIIGTGFSGICTSIELQQKLGITAQLFELDKEIGGTWNQNTYPGCSCDLASHIYSLRSELNPDWSNTFSNQSEILEYLKNVAKKHHIYENTRFQTEVLTASWIDERKQWKLDLHNLNPSSSDDELETVYYDVLFSGVGCLRIPNVPSEFKVFKGQVVHTATWDSSVDFKDKRVALIGSGSSAVQVTPFLVKESSTLISYQRSPPWVFPRYQVAYPEFMKWMFRWIPFAMLFHRLLLFLYSEVQYVVFGYPDSFIAKSVEGLVTKSRVDELTKLGRPDLIPALQPTYRLGCKRVVFSSDYFQAIASPNVSLVRSPIKEIKDKTIITEDGRMEEIDILVLGTGYKTQEGVLGNIEIIGNEGQSLIELWKTELPQFYKSTITHGFPNLFMLLGPTTLLGHHSVVLMMEAQVKYAVNCIREILIQRGKTAVEPTSEAQLGYMSQLKTDLKDTIWTTSCNSWYKNDAGEITVLYPNTVTRFKWTLGQFNEKDYVQYPADESVSNSSSAQ